MEHRVTAVLVAAGSSTRMGFDKLSFDLGGETVLERSVRAFDECPEVDELVIVTGASGENARRAAARCKKPVRLVKGGSTRAESARSGVAAAHGRLVAVHDAARPFVSQSVIADTIAAAARCGAAAPAVPVKDTIKQAKGGNGKTVPEGCMVENTPDRSTLYAVQTPQCFDRAAYLAALDELDEASARLVTDDCSLFELTGRPVELVQGDYANIKITTREDLPRTENGGKKMKKFCIILMILTIIIIGSAAFIKNNETHTEYLRIHIRADSNEAEAQAVKYEVKGEVVKMLTPYLAECRTKAQAEQTLKNLLGEIEKTADAVLAANGFSYRSKASVREEEFPTRVYEDLTLDAGYYDALILELGSGKGDNWWCVVYPPLCFTGGECGYVYKSKILEIIESFKKKN